MNVSVCKVNGLIIAVAEYADMLRCLVNRGKYNGVIINSLTLEVVVKEIKDKVSFIIE